MRSLVAGVVQWENFSFPTAPFGEPLKKESRYQHFAENKYLKGIFYFCNLLQTIAISCRSFSYG